MRAGWILTGVALAALTTGCGGNDGSPADAVPSLSRQLDAVDAAISSGRAKAARSALDELAAETERARAAGILDAADADAILAAIGNLELQLPRAAPQPNPSSDPPSSASSSPTATPDDDSDEGDEERTVAPRPPGKPHAKPGKNPGKQAGKKHHPKPPKKAGHGPGHGPGRGHGR